jgi:hypothetical protein
MEGQNSLDAEILPLDCIASAAGQERGAVPC